jgi:hypothetical protein
MIMENENIITIDRFISMDDIYAGNTRTDSFSYCRPDESHLVSLSKETASKDDDEVLPVVIYRYKFTEEFMQELYKFAKIHQYDERHDFKEAWNDWVVKNEEIAENEMNRLTTLGYEGDVLDKMYKSARYYFRKKSAEKKKPKKRRNYLNLNHDMLEAMDRHIENNRQKEDYQPKSGFISFCKDNEDLLKQSISRIYEQGIKDAEIIEDKIKKTYKNRYFILTKK